MNLFGINNPQALDLFYQAVSMKPVGKLNDFIRENMLARTDVDARLSMMRHAFENLSRAYEAVLKAKRQIELLDPLVCECGTYKSLGEKVCSLDNLAKGIPAYFAFRKIDLLEQTIKTLDRRMQDILRQLENLETEEQRLATRKEEIGRSIAANGGERLNEIEREKSQWESLRKKRLKRDGEYRGYAERIKLDEVHTARDFEENRTRAESLLDTLKAAIESIQTRGALEIEGPIQQKQKEKSQLDEELDSLRNRKTSIPRKSLEIREGMLCHLNLSEEDLPFLGELVQVSEQEKAWEGAIERLLNSPGINLLVPEHLYPQVSDYVNRTRLAGRLTYLRMERRAALRGRRPDPKAVFNKLEFKKEHPYSNWVEEYLMYDHGRLLCCNSIDELRAYTDGVTREGQIKRKGQRHLKDDRFDINDRSRFVLGWSNEQKIRTIETQADRIAKELDLLYERRRNANKEFERLTAERDSCRDLLKVEDFSDIEWQEPVRRIEELKKEERSIKEASDIIAELGRQLRDVEKSIKENRTKAYGLREDLGSCRKEMDERRRELVQAQTELEGLPEEEREKLFPELNTIHLDISQGKEPDLPALQQAQSSVVRRIDQLNRSVSSERNAVTQSILKKMVEYIAEFRVETTEFDASMEAIPEYEKALAVLLRDDLPRHEKQFESLLKTGTINSVAAFHAQLDKERQEIEDRIEAINLSLRDIDYDHGQYIQLVLDQGKDMEIREFQQDLKRCLSGTVGGNLYSEEKFLEIKKLMDRFNGRDGFAEIDQRWTAKVCDVRNWFTFGASVRRKIDGVEVEFFSDSAGKSGGQKEKLAYTILASGLAYQFDLKWDNKRSRSFRFVVIDEAFGRGSDESTRYGLQLFKKLNLQLLIVTPLQKIQIIEDYIHGVHFVQNQEGKNSVLQNLTMKSYQEGKQSSLFEPAVTKASA
jgi:uncharacterized protein YPO0396